MHLLKLSSFKMSVLYSGSLGNLWVEGTKGLAKVNLEEKSLRTLHMPQEHCIDGGRQNEYRPAARNIQGCGKPYLQLLIAYECMCCCPRGSEQTLDACSY